MRNVALVGGAGFIGTHLTRELLGRGYRVKVVDMREPALDVPFVLADVRDPDALAAALNGVEGVLHLASVMGVENCLERSADVERTNMEGTRNVLRVCRESRIRRLLFTSSSEVYGDGCRVPFCEFDEKRPKSVYGKTKLAAEDLLRAAAGDGLTIRIVRYFNVYGPEQRDDFVIKRFVRQALSCEPLTVYGDGSQVRCFTHVRDAVRGTIAAFEYGASGDEVFNIACPQPIRMLDLAHLVEELVGSRNGVRFIPLGDGGVRSADVEIVRRVPDTRRAESLLDFTARISLREGLAEVMSHCA